MLVVALRDDHQLPSPVKSWLGLCLGIRADGQEGVLVALVAHPVETSPHDSSTLEYLEVLAMVGGLEFFGKQGPLENHPVAHQENFEVRS